jgi:hypothetical protein
MAAPSQSFELAEGSAKEWCAQGDDFRTFLSDFVANLPQLDFLDVLSL